MKVMLQDFGKSGRGVRYNLSGRLRSRMPRTHKIVAEYITQMARKT